MASIQPNPQAANTGSTNDPATLAANIDVYLRTKNSPIAGEGTNIVAVAQQYNLDPRLLVALTGAETGFGTNITAGAYNVGNVLYKGLNSPFANYHAAFNAMGKSIINPRNHYNLTSTSTLYSKFCNGPCGRGLLNLNGRAGRKHNTTTLSFLQGRKEVIRPARWLGCLAALAATASSVERTRPAIIRGLQLRYPADWRREDVRAVDTLTIVKPFIAYHGPIQPRGQLQIWVAPSNAPDPSLAGSIAYFTSQDPVREERELRLSDDGRPCAIMSERVAADEVVPPENHDPGPRSVLSDLLFCVLDGRTYVGNLQVWESNPRAAEGRRVLIEVMRSLRPTPSSHPAPARTSAPGTPFSGS